MTISFVCPQGHPLTAPDDMAGKAGKCPHCQTRFLVPQLELDEGATDEPAPAPSAPSNPPVEPPTAGGSRPDTITFICPNGHKLSGPASLRGKLGLCPHCKSRFRIPSSDETSGILTIAESGEGIATASEGSAAAAFTASAPTTLSSKSSGAGRAPAPPPPPPPSPPAPVPQPSMAPAAGPASRQTSPAFIDEVPPAEILDDLDDHRPEATRGDEQLEGAEQAEIVGAWQEPPPLPAKNPSRWYLLFAWFWAQRDSRSVVDLRLRGGQVYQPSWYAPELSDSQVGVFGVQADDGTYDISIISWEQVERVDVRGCEELPADQFH